MTMRLKYRSPLPNEHAAIIASEQNAERITIIYETGAAQTDAANMAAERIDWIDWIDWRAAVLTYRRQKLGPSSERARLMTINHDSQRWPRAEASSASHLQGLQRSTLCGEVGSCDRPLLRRGIKRSSMKQRVKEAG